jgi:CRP/FNR family transcriptional regulator
VTDQHDASDAAPETPESSLGELAAEARALFAPWFVERRFEAGQLLWREGERTGLLVALRSGRVKVYRLLPTGRAITLFLFGPDDVFGFLPFLDGGPYPAYAQALDEVAADVMPRAALLDAVRGRPDAVLTLLTLLGRRLRESFDRIENLSTPGVLPRVAAAIHALRPLATAGSAASASAIVEFPVPAAELAAAIGITPETLSRAISRLVADGVVHRVGPRRLQLLDPEALERTARLADR